MYGIPFVVAGTNKVISFRQLPFTLSGLPIQPFTLLRAINWYVCPFVRDIDLGGLLPGQLPPLY
jgi:hypothetical protein